MADNTSKTETIPKREVDELKQELHQLREDMGNLLSTVKTLGQSTARTTRTKAEQELDQLLQQLNRAYVSARQGGQQAAASAYNEVEQNPMASVAIAFVVGLVTGKIFSQR